MQITRWVDLHSEDICALFTHTVKPKPAYGTGTTHLLSSHHPSHLSSHLSLHPLNTSQHASRHIISSHPFITPTPTPTNSIPPLSHPFPQVSAVAAIYPLITSSSTSFSSHISSHPLIHFSQVSAVAVDTDTVKAVATATTVAVAVSVTAIESTAMSGEKNMKWGNPGSTGEWVCRI